MGDRQRHHGDLGGLYPTARQPDAANSRLQNAQILDAF